MGTTSTTIERAAERAMRAHGLADGRAVPALSTLPPLERRRWLAVARAVLETPAGASVEPSSIIEDPAAAREREATLERRLSERAEPTREPRARRIVRINDAA